MIRHMTIPEAYSHLMSTAIRAANHLGHIPTDLPNYNPLLDADVLEFLDQAVRNEVQAESQKIAHEEELVNFFDALDKEV